MNVGESSRILDSAIINRLLIQAVEYIFAYTTVE